MHVEYRWDSVGVGYCLFGVVYSTAGVELVVMARGLQGSRCQEHTRRKSCVAHTLDQECLEAGIVGVIWIGG